jgi:hypothetical protein
LERDLSSAIFEYAPGSEIVAGRKLWRSAGLYRVPGREWIRHDFAVCGECGRFWDGKELAAACPACNTPAPERRQVYVVPEFGFVSESKPKDPGANPPVRSWNGRTHVRTVKRENLTPLRWRSASGGVVEIWTAPQSELIAVNEGPGGRQFWVCGRCGAGAAGIGSPTEHRNPVSERPCTGTMSRVALAHPFETDIAELTFAEDGHSSTAMLSAMYGLLEGAVQSLGISRDDIDGALYSHGRKQPGLIIFDTVPGGAGNSPRIAERLDQVVKTALDRITRCDCGPETSCYGCLRGYRNQMFHEILSRDEAMTVLDGMKGIQLTA